MNMSTADDCPFNKVPPEIAIYIIEHLNLKTRKSLALTCRKWYETLLALPDSKRCIVYEDRVKWAQNGLFRYGRNGSLICNTLIKFKLVQKLDINRVDISRKEMGIFAIGDFFKFLNKNKSCIEITRMVIRDQLSVVEVIWLDAIADMIKDIDMKGSREKQKGSEEQLSYKKLVETIIKRHLSHSSIQISDVVEIETIATILQQWVRGERPNFEIFHCKLPKYEIKYERQILERMASFIVLGLEDYVGEITNEGTDKEPVITFNVTVPDIGVMNAMFTPYIFRMFTRK